jgi:hypothetical protein
MKNIVQNVTMVAFWLILAAQAVEFFSGYYDHPSSCRVAEIHHVLKESWYARGCRMGGH